MNRYDTLYERLNQRGEIALVPFFCLGNPTINHTLDMIRTAIANGADALEIGFPFSDPVADGPVLQTANIRGLKAGAYPPTCFDMLTTIRTKFPEIPIGLLLYGNIVYAMGLDNFYNQCQSVGVDSVLTPDVPLHLADEFVVSATHHGIAPIFIAPPNATEKTITDIATKGQAYTYVVARSGVTGTENDTDNTNVQTSKSIIDALNTHNAPAPFLGFGISEPKHIKNTIQSGAKGTIVGSAIGKIINKYTDDNTNTVNDDALNTELGDYIKTLKSATKINQCPYMI